MSLSIQTCHLKQCWCFVLCLIVADVIKYVDSMDKLYMKLSFDVVQTANVYVPLLCSNLEGINVF